MELEAKDFRGLSKKIEKFILVFGLLCLAGLLVYALGIKPWGYDITHKSMVFGLIMLGAYMSIFMFILPIVQGCENTVIRFYQYLYSNNYEIEEMDWMLSLPDNDLSWAIVKEVNWRGQHIPVELTDFAGIRQLLSSSKEVAQIKIKNFEYPKKTKLYSLFSKLFFYKGDAYALVRA
jgi:hypothetical protein